MSSHNRRHSKKLGRNDPCHCGSGKKYKKCHLNQDSLNRLGSNTHFPDPKIIEKFQARHEAKESLRKSVQGEGRPIISTEYKGHRLVAVGNKLFFSKLDKTKTFIDFLGNYIRQILDPKWGNAEIAKPLEHRHPILQWYDKICHIQEEYIIEEGQIYDTPFFGVARAYYGLAYNLYLLQHNVEIQDYLLKRLKQKNSFHAAYYETFVAAWFILAGFTLSLENEQDGTVTHCEFSATSRSGKSFSVEAKTRAPGKPHLDVGNQLYSALVKAADHDRIVFIDVNVPSGFNKEDYFNEISSCIQGRETKLTVAGEPAPPAYVVVTNHPYHLHLTEENIICAVLAEGFKISDYGSNIEFPSLIDAYKALMKHAEFQSVIDACHHYQIPTTFDGELPEYTFGEAERYFFIGKTYELENRTKGVLTTGTVIEQEKKAYLIFQLKDDRSSIYTVPLSDAELRAYRQHPETFFGQVTNTNKHLETPMDLFLFFYNGYKETPREKILEFFKDSSDLENIKKLSLEELRLKYAERCTLSVLSNQNQKPATKTDK